MWLWGIGVALLLAAVAVQWRHETRPIVIERLREMYALPKSEFTALAGVETHIVDEGEGPVVILLHGNANSLWLWNDWSKLLMAAGYRVIRFDMPPYGLSGLAPGNGCGIVATHSALVELMDRKGIEHAVLVGTANGGPPATWYAYTHPARVAGLVLINTPFYPAKGSTPTLAGQRLMREYIFRHFGQPWLASWLYVKELAGWGQAIDLALVSHIHDLGRRADMPDALAAYGSSFSFASVQWNPEQLTNQDMLAQVEARTLIMWSGRSILPIDEAQRLADVMVRSRPAIMTFPQAGHWLPIYQPAQTLTAVVDFLSAQPVK